MRDASGDEKRGAALAPPPTCLRKWCLSPAPPNGNAKLPPPSPSAPWTGCTLREQWGSQAGLRPWVGESTHWADLWVSQGMTTLPLCQAIFRALGQTNRLQPGWQCVVATWLPKASVSAGLRVACEDG